MIQMQTKLMVADNTGVKEVRCIKVLGGSKKMVTGLGDVIVVSAIKTTPTSKVKKGEVVRGVIVRVKKKVRRKDGTFVKFDDNAIVLVNKEGEPLGTRIFGIVAREVRAKGFNKIISLSPEVL